MGDTVAERERGTDRRPGQLDGAVPVLDCRLRRLARVAMAIVEYERE